METSYRNVTLVQLIEETGSAMSDLAKWPDSDATRDKAASLVKLLRKTFKEDSYPRGFLFLAMCQVAHDMYSSSVHRNVTQAGLKAGWLKIGDLLGEDKP